MYSRSAPHHASSLRCMASPQITGVRAIWACLYSAPQTGVFLLGAVFLEARCAGVFFAYLIRRGGDVALKVCCVRDFFRVLRTSTLYCCARLMSYVSRHQLLRFCVTPSFRCGFNAFLLNNERCATQARSLSAMLIRLRLLRQLGTLG